MTAPLVALLFTLAQLEPEAFTAAKSFNKAIGANPPDVVEAANILAGYSKPAERNLMQSRCIIFLRERATGTVEAQSKKIVKLFDAFDASFADGDSGRQRARTFIRIREELLGRTTTEAEIERSASEFVARLRKMPAARRDLLREFGRLAKENAKDR